MFKDLPEHGIDSVVARFPSQARQHTQASDNLSRVKEQENVGMESRTSHISKGGAGPNLSYLRIGQELGHVGHIVAQGVRTALAANIIGVQAGFLVGCQHQLERWREINDQ